MIKFAPRRLGKAFWRKRHLRRVLQDEEKLGRIIKTFDVLSKVRSKSGKAAWCTRSHPSPSPPSDHLVTPFLLILFFLITPSPVSSDWLPTAQGPLLPLTNQEGKLQVLGRKEVPRHPQPDATASQRPFLEQMFFIGSEEAQRTADLQSFL